MLDKIIKQLEDNSVEKLEINGHIEEFKKFTIALKNCKSLKTLNINLVTFNNKQLSMLADAISNNKSLHKLKINSCNSLEITNKFASSIKNNKLLKVINLSFNRLNKFDAETLETELSGNKTLKKLSLAGNNFGEEGINNIADLIINTQSITTLDLSENKINDYSVILDITRIIDNNFTLSRLNLSNNHITDDGGKHILKAIEKNYSIIDLNLENNSISEDILFAIKGKIQRNQKMALEILNFTREIFSQIPLCVSRKITEREFLFKTIKEAIMIKYGNCTPNNINHNSIRTNTLSKVQANQGLMAKL